MNKDLKQEFERLHTRLNGIETRLNGIEMNVATLQYDTAVQFRAIRSELAALMKNLDPLGDPNEAADLYGRVKYLELKLGIESGK